MLLTAKQIAREVQMSPVTITTAARLGELHGFNRGKHTSWRFERECADAWIRGLECPHGTGSTR